MKIVLSYYTVIHIFIHGNMHTQDIHQFYVNNNYMSRHIWIYNLIYPTFMMRKLVLT